MCRIFFSNSHKYKQMIALGFLLLILLFQFVLNPLEFIIRAVSLKHSKVRKRKGLTYQCCQTCSEAILFDTQGKITHHCERLWIDKDEWFGRWQRKCWEKTGGVAIFLWNYSLVWVNCFIVFHSKSFCRNTKVNSFTSIKHACHVKDLETFIPPFFYCNYIIYLQGLIKFVFVFYWTGIATVIELVELVKDEVSLLYSPQLFSTMRLILFFVFFLVKCQKWKWHYAFLWVYLF